MPLKFDRLTRAGMRRLEPGERLMEHGITYERMSDGDGRFIVNIMVDGQRIHRVIGRESEGVTRQQAEEFIEQARTDARAGRLNLPKGRKVGLGFEEASEQYLVRLEEEGGRDITFKRMRFRKHLVPYFGRLPLMKLEKGEVERYKKDRLGAGAKPATVNRELAAVSHLLTKAREWGWLDREPCRVSKLKENNGRIVYLTAAQVERLMSQAAGGADRDVALFTVIALETSMRRGEILSIRREHIDLERRVIDIPKAKAGARVQPITRYLAEVLAEQLEAMPPEQSWLFPSPEAKCGHRTDLRQAFRSVVRSVGLDPRQVTPHVLRHTAITHLVQAGVDLPTVQRISGHRTLQMVVRYSHQNGEHIQSAMDRLEARYRPEGPRDGEPGPPAAEPGPPLAAPVSNPDVGATKRTRKRAADSKEEEHAAAGNAAQKEPTGRGPAPQRPSTAARTRRVSPPAGPTPPKRGRPRS